MIIEVNGNDYDKVRKVLTDAGIDCLIYDNVYKAVWAEEINNTFDSILNEDDTNVDEIKTKELRSKLTDTLYLSKGSESAFQMLTELSEHMIRIELDILK